MRLTYFLNAHCYCCELEDGAIILELVTGTYIGIHEEHLPELRLSVLNWPVSHETEGTVGRIATRACQELIAALLTRGILTTSPTPKQPPAPPMPKVALTADLSIGWGEAPIKHLPQFIKSLLMVVLYHHDKKLASLLRRIAQRQHRTRGQSRITLDDTKELVASFLKLCIWFYTADRHCLFDSLVLADFLTKKMIPCTFVIGVSTKPFLAHAWVQTGEFVLNDTAEHVQMFTPILAVGGPH